MYWKVKSTYQVTLVQKMLNISNSIMFFFFVLCTLKMYRSRLREEILGCNWCKKLYIPVQSE